jgi:hypothetical protein
MRAFHRQQPSAQQHQRRVCARPRVVHCGRLPCARLAGVPAARLRVRKKKVGWELSGKKSLIQRTEQHTAQAVDAPNTSTVSPRVPVCAAPSASTAASSLSQAWAKPVPPATQAARTPPQAARTSAVTSRWQYPPSARLHHGASLRRSAKLRATVRSGGDSLGGASSSASSDTVAPP